MKLSVLERLTLLQTLPREGNLTQIRIIRKLREDLSFSEDEHKALGFTNKDDRLLWRREGDPMKDIDIGETASTVIGERLKALDAAGKLTEDHLPLYDRFIKEGSTNA
jgi:hypothetical protein